MTRLDVDVPAIAAQCSAIAALRHHFARDVAEGRARIRAAVAHARDASGAAEQDVSSAAHALDAVPADEDDSDARNRLAEALDRAARADHRLQSAEAAAARAWCALDRSAMHFDSAAGRAWRQLDAQVTLFRQAWNVRLDPAPDTASSSPSARTPAAPPSAMGAAPDGPPMPTPPLPHGLEWVPLAALPAAEFPDDLPFTRDVARDQMTAMMRTFRLRVLPRLARDGTTGREDLARVDRAAGRDPAQAPTDTANLGFAWDCLLGSGAREDDLIVIDVGYDGALSFNSGRHRALVARALGWSHVPARVRRRPAG